jgi:hypothetical protein
LQHHLHYLGTTVSLPTPLTSAVSKYPAPVIYFRQRHAIGYTSNEQLDKVKKRPVGFVEDAHKTSNPGAPGTAHEEFDVVGDIAEKQISIYWKRILARTYNQTHAELQT